MGLFYEAHPQQVFWELLLDLLVSVFEFIYFLEELILKELLSAFVLVKYFLNVENNNFALVDFSYELELVISLYQVPLKLR